MKREKRGEGQRGEGQGQVEVKRYWACPRATKPTCSSRVTRHDALNRHNISLRNAKRGRRVAVVRESEAMNDSTSEEPLPQLPCRPDTASHSRSRC